MEPMNELKSVIHATASLARVDLVEDEGQTGILVTEDQESGSLTLQRASGATLTVSNAQNGDSWVIVDQQNEKDRKRLLMERRSAVLYILGFVLAKD